ncbi:MAG: hypothetical protein ABH843_03485, partial [Candidatus Omnitrophota bacterium]
ISKDLKFAILLHMAGDLIRSRIEPIKKRVDSAKTPDKEGIALFSGYDNLRKYISATEILLDNGAGMKNLKIGDIARIVAFNEDLKTGKVKDDSLLKISEKIEDIIEPFSRDDKTVRTKSSSAGTVSYAEFSEKVSGSESKLISALYAGIEVVSDEETPLKPELLEILSQELIDLGKELFKLKAEGKIDAEQEEILESRISAQKSIIEFAEVCAPAAKIEKDGTIIIDPDVIPDPRQRAAVISMLGDKRLHSALEHSLSSRDNNGKVVNKTNIVLLGDLDIAGLEKENAILISDSKKISGVRLFKVGVSRDDMLVPMAQLIAIARGLLSLNSSNFDSIFPAIKNAYQKYTNDTIGAEIEQALREGNWKVFELIMTTLPSVEKLDSAQIEVLQRQGLAALIAA